MILALAFPLLQENVALAKNVVHAADARIARSRTVRGVVDDPESKGRIIFAFAGPSRFRVTDRTTGISEWANDGTTCIAYDVANWTYVRLGDASKVRVTLPGLEKITGHSSLVGSETFGVEDYLGRPCATRTVIYQKGAPGYTTFYDLNSKMPVGFRRRAGVLMVNYVYRNLQLNSPMPASTFRFTPPKEARRVSKL